MNPITMLLATIDSIIIVVMSIYFYVSYTTHIEMNKGRNMPYKFCRMKDFLELYKKYEKNEDIKYDSHFYSIFLQKHWNNILYLHASIVMVEGNCLIFHPIDWLLYNYWIRKEVKKHSS